MRFKYYLRGAGIGVIAATIILSVAFLLHDNISDEEVIRRAMKLGMVMQENASGTLGDHKQSDASAVDLENGNDPESGVKTDSDPLTDASQSNPDDYNDDPENPNQGNTDSSEGTSQPTDPDASQPPSSASDGSEGQPSADQTDDTKKPADSESGEKKDPPSKKDPSDSKKEEKEEKEEPDEVEIVIAAGDVSRMVSAKVFEAGLVDDAEEFNSYLGSHDYDNMLQPGTYKIKKGASFRQIAKILTKQ